MPAQLTPDGIEVFTQPEIQQLIEDSLSAEFGNLDFDPSSVNGQVIGVYTKPSTDISELIEDVYLAFSPSNAEGISLDYLLLLNNLTRLPALSTVVPIGMEGVNNTVIPQGTIIKSDPPANDSFETVSEFTLSNLLQLRAYIRIDTYVPSVNYEVTIGGILYSVPSGVGGDTAIVTGLIVTAIDNDPLAVVTTEYTVGNDWFLIVAKSGAFDTVVGANITFLNYGTCQSVVKDSISSVAETLTIIDTPVTGFNAVINFETGTPGRPTESDSDARIRRLQSLQILGAGTLPAMVARMQRDIDGAVTVKGFENRTDLPDAQTRPPHSTEIVIEGGTDADVGNLLWLIKPGGIETFGSTTFVITDDNGDPQAMNFTRPTVIYAHIKVTITLHAESTYPVNGDDLIKEAVKAFGDTFSIGQDLIRDSFYSPVFTVPGIETVIIGMDLTPNIGDAPVYTSPDILAVDTNEVALFDLTNVEVVVL